MSVIEVNVGGEVYSTTRSTMTRYPESMIGKMFSGQIETAKDKDGRMFIDRDGKLFRHVLNFLRTAALDLPKDFKDYDELYNEAKYYQLKPLIDSLQNRQQQEGGILSNDLDADVSIITINVGGECYSTNLSTITKYPDSVLGKMFTGLTPTIRDKHGRLFIDRDGKIFRYVLNFLRNSDLVLPSNFKEVKALCIEADFYQIKPLKQALQSWNKQKDEDLLMNNNNYMYVFVFDITDPGICTFTSNIEILKALLMHTDSNSRAIEEQERQCLQLGMNLEQCLVAHHYNSPTGCSARAKWYHITSWLLRKGCLLISSTTSFGNYALRKKTAKTNEPIKFNSHDVWWCDVSQIQLKKRIPPVVESHIKVTETSRGGQQDSIVELNIGGTFYSTSLSAMKKYQHSVLGLMFYYGLIPIAKDKDDRVFIDRDGKVFRHILNFLRTSTLLLPEDFQEFDVLCNEAKFFKIQPLTKSLQDFKQNNDIVKLSERDRLFVFLVGIEDPNICYIYGNIEVLERIPSRYFVDKHGDILDNVEGIWRDRRVVKPGDMLFTITGNNTKPSLKKINEACSSRAWRDHLTQYLINAGCCLISSTTSYGN